MGPIHLPGYLDQDQIVTRISQNRVTLSDDRSLGRAPGRQHWAGAGSQLIGPAPDRSGKTAPLAGSERPTYQLEIDVLSFETDTAGTAHLVARWFLRDVASRQTIAEKETRLTASGAGTSTEQSVASLSKALGDFSVAIANVIREFVHSSGTQPTVGAGNRTSPTAAVSLRGPAP